MKQIRSYIAAILASLALAAPAFAGQTSDVTVTVNTSTRTASGSIGTARANKTNPQDIGCSIWLMPNPDNTQMSATYITCTATNSAGTSVYCIGGVEGPSISVIDSLSDDSYLKFTWDANGNCTSFEVRNYSYYRPRQS